MVVQLYQQLDQPDWVLVKKKWTHFEPHLETVGTFGCGKRKLSNNVSKAVP